MDGFETKLETSMDMTIPDIALHQALDAQHKELLDRMLGVIEPNKEYIISLKCDYYEDFPNYKHGYKSAILIEEYKGEG